MDEESKKAGGMAAGGAVGTGVGLGASVAAVSAAGVPGLSAAGITSGLAAIGGGSMLAGGVLLTGGVAVLAIAGTYGGYRVVKWLSK